MGLRSALTTVALVVAVAGTGYQPVAAQGLRVSTHVYDLNAQAATGQKSAVSGSLSIFHHGKVYDYVDAADEIVVLDLTERRFTILNTARQLRTSLDFDEMRHLLNSRGPAAEEYIADILKSRRPESKAVAELLRFQMNPEFDQQYDGATGTLQLQAPTWKYEVTTTAEMDADLVQHYLLYADRMAQLNHLLHPGALFPEPRMALNAALRELQRLPLTVRLDLRPTEPLHLRAEHRFTSGLQDDDLRRIARWEAALDSDTLQTLSFRSYQQTVLVASRK